MFCFLIFTPILSTNLYFIGGFHLILEKNANSLGLNSSMESQPSSSQNSITRRAGGRKEVEKEMQVPSHYGPSLRFSLFISSTNYYLEISALSGHSGHEGIHEQPSKCSPPERDAYHTSDLGSRGLYPLSINMCGEKEYSRSFYELHIRPPLPPSGNNGLLL